MKYSTSVVKEYLDSLVDKYNNRDFIENDPISIPHSLSKKQDIEIMGFMAAIFAWGQRKTIINKSRELISRMGNSPYEFIMNHTENDLRCMEGFKHRTFNDEDLLYFVDFFKRHYSKYDSLEDAFLIDGKFETVKKSLIHFNEYFCQSPYFPKRTGRHVSTPAKNSACKRINMFLRWMVRSDDRGVDFGIWKKIDMSSLIIPVDVHVERTCKMLGIVPQEAKVDWKMADAISLKLKEFDPDDPVKYDFALFGVSEAGLLGKIKI